MAVPSVPHTGRNIMLKPKYLSIASLAVAGMLAMSTSAFALSIKGDEITLRIGSGHPHSSLTSNNCKKYSFPG